MSASDTIAAIATAPGPAGIGIVRISGPHSLTIADALFIGSGRCPPPSTREGGTFLHGYIRQVETAPDTGASSGNDPADEAILLIYRAPHSYTREDVVEIQIHGGRLPAQRVLRQVLACGARMADPGEFTKRAFLNGRIDLTQAEAVMDLIRAQSDLAATSAIRQLRGDVRNCISAIYDSVLFSLSEIEASLDFPEEEMPADLIVSSVDRMRSSIEDMDRMLRTWQEGRVLREGTQVVIAGRPNVGKSTLLNAILRVERAIVSDIPGTTRDTIEETVVIGGYPVHLIDTAGLRESDCPIERQGIQRAVEVSLKCDILVYVVDASGPVLPEDIDYIRRLSEWTPGYDPTQGADCPPSVLVVLNKIDKGQVIVPTNFQETPCVACSLIDPQGAKPVVDALEQILHDKSFTSQHASISERHYRGIRSAMTHVQAAMSILDEHSDHADAHQPECAAIHLRAAMDELGGLTGLRYTEHLLDEIFLRFCIGK